MLKILMRVMMVILIASCSKNENIFAENNVKLKKNIVKKENGKFVQPNPSKSFTEKEELKNSLKRIIDIIVKKRKNENYVLEKYDKNIFKDYAFYYEESDDEEYLSKTSNLLLKLRNRLNNLDYDKEIEEKIVNGDFEYLCSLKITKKPEKIGYVDGDVFGKVYCYSEYDSMSRFEEIYLTKIDNRYYILDLLIP